MFRALRVPGYRRYAAGATVSNVGTWMHRVGQAWLVLELTGNPVMLGFVTALQFAPMLFVAPWGGALADRVNRRTLMLATQSALAFQALALAAITLLGYASVTWVAAFALLLGVTKALDSPARQTMVSDLVGADLVQNAVALNSASFNAARLVGPAIAGLMISQWGTGVVFVANALTFLGFIAALRTLPAGPSSGLGKGRAQGGVRSGLRFTLGRPDLLVVIAVAGVVAMLALNSQMTIAVMTTQEYGAGAQTYGMLASVMAIGSLSGALLAAKRARPTVRSVFVSAGLLSIFTVTAGLMPSVVTFGAALVLCGVAALSMMTAANAYLQVYAGEEYRGRVMALYLAIFFGTTPIGAPLVGWLAATWGGRSALVVAGLAALTSVVVMFVVFHRSQWGTKVRHS